MGRSKSESQANQTTNTTNQDNRIANESGIVATSGANITANIESVDKEIVNHALDFAGATDAANSESFNKLLDAGLKILEGGKELTMQSQQTVLQTMQSAENDKKDSLDQKTIIVLGVATMGAIAAMSLKKRAA